MHAGSVVTDEDDLHWAMCQCGWRSGPSQDRKELWKLANEHSDPEVLDRLVYETQLMYPQYTREQIINNDFD